jgi:hypothetical protein
MKVTAILSLLPLLALGAPTASQTESELYERTMVEGYENLFRKGIKAREAEIASSIEARQLGSSTRNELESGRCADAIVIYARGTTESGNVGTVLSGPLFLAIDSATVSSHTTPLCP